MLNRAAVSLQRLLGRLPTVAIFAARLYLAIVVFQFVAGFAVGVSLALFDYDVELIYSLLPADG
jgi:hypothetical protein